MSSKQVILAPTTIADRFHALRDRIAEGGAPALEETGGRVNAFLLALVERRLCQLAETLVGE